MPNLVTSSWVNLVRKLSINLFFKSSLLMSLSLPLTLFLPPPSLPLFPSLPPEFTELHTRVYQYCCCHPGWKQVQEQIPWCLAMLVDFVTDTLHTYYNCPTINMHTHILTCTYVYIHTHTHTDDHTRIKLKKENNESGSDYINASFIVREKACFTLYMYKFGIHCF